MKILLLSLLFALPCLAEESFIARLTFYTVDSKYGRKTASGAIAKQGRTVAAEKKFKFGQKFKIPALKQALGSEDFKVEDRGRDVQNRKASGGKVPVIDIFVNSNAKIKQLAKTKQFNRVRVYLP